MARVAMFRGLATTFALVVVIAFAPALSRAQGQGLDVHEWGTFTSIAGKDGLTADWLLLSGPNDLPCASIVLTTTSRLPSAAPSAWKRR